MKCWRRFRNVTTLVLAGVLSTAYAQIPDVPTSLTGYAVSQSQINLSWTNNYATTPYNDIRIERAVTLGGTWTEIAILSGNEIRFQNSGLTPAVDYYYRIRASAAGGFSNYSNTINIVTIRSSIQVQFASSVLGFSTEFTPSSWAAMQMLGAPNIYPASGDLIESWAPSTQDDQREFIELGFATPMQISRVEVFQTLNPGTIDTIYVRNSGTGLWTIVYEGTAGPIASPAAVLKADFPLTAFQVDAVRLAVNSPAVPGWNEFDAISISDPAPVTVVPANAGAMFFNGATDRVRITDANIANPPRNPSAFAISGTSITVEAWVFPISVPQPGQTATIVVRPGATFTVDPFRTYGLTIQTTAGDGIARFAFTVADGVTPYGGGNDITVFSATPVPTGRWSHVAGSYDGTAVQLYINGDLAVSLPFSGSMGAGSTGLYIGGTVGDMFNGLIDDVRLWNNTRTAAQIQGDHINLETGVESGLAGYWQFDVEGTPAAGWTPDLTPNSNDLIEQGAKVVAFPFGSNVQFPATQITADRLYAVNGLPYRSTLRANGYPTAMFALVTTPGGMTLEGDTLVWTPTAADAGFHDLIIDATNTSGTLRDTLQLFVELASIKENANRFMINNRGKIGATGVYNEGIVVNGQNGVYTADFSLVSRADTLFSGGLYTTLNSFVPAAGFSSVPTPAAGYTAEQTSFTDANDPRPIGVRVFQTTYMKASPPDDRVMVVEYRFVNESGFQRNNVYAQVAADFDVGVVTNNIAAYDTALGLVYAVEAGGATNPSAYGMQALRGPVSGMSVWFGSVAPYVRTIQNLTTFSAPVTVPNDIRGMINMGPFNLAPAETASVMIAYLGAPSVDELRFAAARAKQVVIDPATIVSLPLTDEIEPNNSLVEPNVVTLGTTLRGDISSQTDVDYYSFSLAGYTNVQIIGQQQVNSNLRYRYEVFDNGGGLQYSSWWYFSFDQEPYGLIYLAPGAYTLRVTQYSNYASYPTKTALPKGSKALELELQARQRNLMMQSVPLADTSGGYQIILREFEPILGRPAYMYQASSGENFVSLLTYFSPGDYGTVVELEWGLTTAYGNTVYVGTYDPSGVIGAYAQIEGMQPGRTYQARMRMSSSLGTSYGKNSTFTTPSASLEWTRQQLPNGNTSSLYGVQVIDDHRLYVAGSGVFRSDNGGLTWTEVSPYFTQYHYSNDIHFVDADKGVSVGGGTELVSVTTNAGVTWTSGLYVPSPTQITKINSFDGSNFIGVGGSGSIVRSTDFGSTWTLDTIPGANNNISVEFLSSTTVLVADNYGQIFRSTDAGLTWNLTQTINEPAYTLKRVDGLTVYIGTHNSIFRSTDGGFTWSQIAVNIGYTFGMYMIDADRGYVVSLDGVIRTTIDGWQTHTVVPSGFGGHLLGIDGEANNLSIVGNEGTILRKGVMFESEPNSNSADASSTSYNATIHGVIDPDTDVDYIQFSGSAGDTVDLSASTLPGSTLNFGVYLTLYDGVGTLISGSDYYVSNPMIGTIDRMVRILPYTGTYFVRVSDPNYDISSFPNKTLGPEQQVEFPQAPGKGMVLNPQSQYLLTLKRGGRTAPSITKIASTNIFSDHLTLRASMLPNGGTSTATVEYGTTPSFGSSLAADEGAATGLNAITRTASVTGLIAGTKYYYRWSATNEFGTSYDLVDSVVTPSAPDRWQLRPPGVSLEFTDVSFDETLYFGMTVGFNSAAYRTSDAGVTWQQVNIPPIVAGQTYTYYGVKVLDPFTAIVVGTPNFIKMTTDGGNTWSTVSNPVAASWRDISFLDRWNGIVSGSGRMIRTTDGGFTWTSTATVPGLPILWSAQMMSDQRYVGSTSSGSFVVTTDQGTTWTETVVSPGIQMFGIAFFDNLTGIIAGDLSEAYRTTDGGVNWQPVSIPYETPSLFRKAAVEDVNTAWIAAWDGNIYRTPDKGVTWEASPTGFGSAIRSVRKVAPNVMVASGTSGTVFVRDVRPPSPTFIVHMHYAIQAGWFDPATDSLLIRGNVAPLDWTGTSYRLTDVDGDSLYILQVVFPDTAQLEYKFVIRHRGQDIWELGHTGAGNRSLTLVRDLYGYYQNFDNLPNAYQPVAGQYSPGSNVIGLWHLDEDPSLHSPYYSLGGNAAFDRSDSLRHGYYTGTTMVGGKTGNARFFNGSGDGITLENGFFYPSGVSYSFTLEGWINVDQYPTTNGDIIYSGGKYNAFLGITTAGRLEIGLRGAAGLVLDSAAQPIPLNQWIHVAMTYDAGAKIMRSYQNGRMVSEFSLGVGFSPAATVSQAFIGKGQAPQNFYFRGAIDEVRVSDRLVTPQEFNLVLPPTYLSGASRDSRVELTWPAAQGGLSAILYRIYRGADSTTMTVYDSLAGPATVYTDTAVVNGAVYFYRVTAVDVTGFQSAATPAYRGTPLPVPSLTVTSPVRNSYATSPGGPLTLTFNTDLDSSSVDIADIKMRGTLSGPMTISSATYQVGTRQMVIQPSGSFVRGEQVEVLLRRTVRNLNGDSLANVVLFRYWIGMSGGTGALTSFTTSSFGSSPVFVAAGDIDNDDDIDIVSADVAGSSVSIYKNNGSGGFTATTNVSLAGNSARGLVLADLDGDNDLDLAVTLWSSNQIAVYQNSGSGSFPGPAWTTSTGANPMGIAASDFNGDGLTDLVVSEFTSHNVMLYLNQGGATFSLFGGVGVAVSDNPNTVVVNDFNRDGTMDFAVTSFGTGSVRWFRNVPGGFAQSMNLVAGGGSYGLATGDVDGDGNLDLVAGVSVSTDNIRIIRLNSTGGVLSNTTVTLGGGDIRGVAIGDATGDGLNDILVTDYASNSVRILRNDGSNSYTEVSGASVGTGPWGIVSGDFDNDGDLDVVVGHEGSNSISVLRNNVDNSPPSMPIGLTATVQSGRVTLTWSANGEPDLSRYVIFRGITPAGTSRLDSVAVGTTTYADESVTDSTVYFYQLRAVDVAGNESGTTSTLPAVAHASATGEYAADSSTALLVHFAESSGSYVVDESPNQLLGTSTHQVVSGRFGAARQAPSVAPDTAAVFSSFSDIAVGGYFTVESWVYVSGVYANGYGIVRSNTFQLYLGSAGNAGLLQLLRYDGSQWQIVTSTAAVPTGQWTHVAGSWDGTTAKLFIDGVAVGTSSSTSAYAAVGPLQIMNPEVGAPGGTTIADEIRISKVARDPSAFNLQLPPRSLAASAAGTTINLSWQNGGGGVANVRYRIYRGTDSTTVSLLDSTTTTVFSNSDLVAATEYFYRVSSVDASGFESPKSFAAGAMTSSAPSVATATTFAGAVQGSSDGTYTGAQFSFPEAVTIDRRGVVYVADGGNGSIRKITPTRVVTTLATAMGTVSGIAVDSVGNLYVSSVNSHLIYKVTPDGEKTVYAGSGNPGLTDGDSTNADLNGPSGLAFDGQGNLFVADRDNNVIRKIATNRFVSTIAGSALGSAGFAGGSSSASRFNAPSGLAFDGAGRLYVADRDNNAIRKIVFGSGSNVTVTTLAGKGPASSGYANGDTSIATFTLPTGISVDPFGNFFVADRDNSVIRRISATSQVTTIAGAPLVPGAVDDTASAARFTLPRNLAADPTTTLYVADWGNHKIRRVITNYVPSAFSAAASSVTATAGTMNGYVNPNGLPTTAYFEYGLTTAYGAQTSEQSVGQGFAFVAQSSALSGLSANTVYHYRMVATNESGTTFGQDETFTTLLSAPGTPTLASPENSATNQPVTTTVSWNAALNATSYRLQVSLASNFATLVLDDSTLSGTSRQLSSLLHDTVYYWQVRAENVTGVSAYSSTRFFRTIVDTPDTPTLAAPSDAATDQPVEIALSWNASPRTTTYHLQVSPSNTFGVLTFEDSTLTGVSSNVSGLSNLTTYYWRVRAKNVGGTSAYSATRQFTTIIALPADPTLSSPADLATQQATTLNLNWNAASRAASYRLQVATDSAFASLVLNDSTLTGTSRSVSGLLNATTYYWRVRAKNAAGVSNYSAFRRFTTIVSPPDVPLYVGPDSGAVNVAPTLSLVWKTSARAQLYQLQMSTSGSFASILLNDSTLTDTSRVIGPLNTNLQYYWRVRAVNAGGASSFGPIWVFRTVDAIPDVPSLATPLDSAINQSISLQLAWNAAARAVTYRVEVYSDTNAVSASFVDSNATGTTRSVGPLLYNTKYYWRVRAQNAGGYSDYTAWRSFTTILEAPTVPVLVSPDTTAVVSTAPTLTWRASARAASYRLQVSLFNSFGTTIVDQSGITDTTFGLTGLLNDTTYYWRLTATNGGGTTAFSATWKFRTVIAPPDAPTLAAPANNATGEPINETFSWSPAARAVSYRLEVSTLNTFATLEFVDSTITGTSRQVTLSYLTTYYWRVRARNAGGDGQYSSTRTLTTIIQAPGAPTLWSPDSGMTDQPTTVTLTWLGAPRAATYRLQVSQISNFSTTVTDQSALADTSFVVGPLLNDTDYFWRVTASNAGGTSTWSQIRKFRTVISAPAVPTLLSPADGATGLLTTLQLTWNAAARAASYRLQTATDPSFTTNLVTTSNIVGTSQIVAGLQNSSTYYWRVEAENAGGTSGYSGGRQFSTVIAAPTAAPVLTGPADNSQSVLPSGAFTWQAVATASHYRLQISTSNVFSSTVYDDSTITSLTANPAGLAFSTNYFWRVYGKNAGGSGPWSAVRSFRTVPATPVSALSPRPLDFGSLEAGLQTDDRQITLSNNGGANLNVTSTVISGTNSSEFAIISGGGSFSVVPGNVRQIVVRFAPQSRGAKSATLVLQTNDQSENLNGQLVDSLSGFATDNTAPFGSGTTASVSPAAWTNQSLYTVSWSPAVTDVSGVSNVWYSINSIPTVGSPGSSLALGGSSSFQVSFPAQGISPLYFYFEDGAGNKDPNLRYQVTLKFDNVAPLITHDSTTVTEVTVTNGVADKSISIAATFSDATSGIQTMQVQYRRVIDPTFTTVAYTGPVTIPASTFVSNGGPVGVDYRVVAIDSAGNQTATRTYSIPVRTATVPPPQPTPLPAASALPAGTDITRAYRMFSVPYNLDDKKPSSVVPASLGPHAANNVSYANWRMQRYVGGVKQDYEAFRDQDAFVPGAGFFLIVRDANKRVSVGTGSVVNAQSMNDVGIGLQTGWNLVGNPLLRDIAVDSLRVTSGTIQQLAYFSGSGATSGWDLSPVSLKQWEGLAVKVSQPTNLLFRTIGSQPGAAEPEVLPVRLNASKAVSKDEMISNWVMNVDAMREDNGMSDVGTVIGMVDGAREDIDPYDRFHPPFVGVRNVAIAYVNANENFVHDIRPVNNQGGVWEMRLVTGDAGAKVTLRIDGADRLPDPQFEAFLIDPEQKMAYNLKTTSQVTVNSLTGERNLRLVVGRKDFLVQNSAGVDLYPQQYQLFSNYPNPFNPETVIRYTIADRSAAAFVSLKVYDVLGRDVATLVEKEQLPGYYEIPFNGIALSSGTYFYRLQVNDGRGTAVYSSARRMMLIK